MATKNKKHKHTLNPIIILSFIIIGLLFVILAIALKENIDVNGSLRAAVYVCRPATEKKNVTGTDYITLSTPMLPVTDALKRSAADKLKTQFCNLQKLKDENQIPCTDPKCESKKTEDNPLDSPKCTARITELTYDVEDSTTPPFNVKFTAKLNASLYRNCVPKAGINPTPAVYPQCYKSGSVGNNCNPDSKGTFKVENTKRGTATDEYLNDNQLVALATERAIEAAKAGLETKCAALATNDPKYQCTPNPKACDAGCKAEGKAVYNPPYQPIDTLGDPITDPPVRTTSACMTKIVPVIPSPPHSVTIEATCYAACNYTQNCVPISTPSPTATPMSTPIPSNTPSPSPH